MPWQRHVADVALEVDPVSGRLAYRRIVLTVPRQSGKTTLLLALFMHRALVLSAGAGPQVMAFTAQSGLEARMRLKREWHETLKRTPFAETYQPSWLTGAEAFLFHNSSRLQVIAGTEKSGHGQTLDLGVIDEAFAQPDGRLEQAMSPAMMTRPEAQLWLVSTAGSPTDVWFREKITHAREAVDGSAGIAFFEWSAPQDAELTDRSVWWECMPALGHTVTEKTVAAECLGLPPDEFRRAYLNQWVERGAEAAFDLALWGDLSDPDVDPPTAGTLSFGVATAPDRSWSCIGAAWRRSDGSAHLISSDYRPGSTWVAERVAALRAKYGGPVSVDIASRGLVPEAVEVSQQVQAQAHNGLADGVAAGLIRHGNERELTMSVRGARWKPQGETRVLDRKGSVDISPLIAVALALHGLTAGQGGPSKYERDEGFVEL